MNIKVLTWNIGGGKILGESSDPSLLASYSEDGFEYIVKTLREENPDIIALQETHKNEQDDFVSSIAKELNYKYYIHDSTSPSHIDKDYQLGHAIISKYPI